MDAAAEDEGSEGAAVGVLNVEPGEVGVAGGRSAQAGVHILSLAEPSRW